MATKHLWFVYVLGLGALVICTVNAQRRVCPSFRLEECPSEPEPDECTYDANCTGGTRCCTNGCNLECQVPVKTTGCPIPIDLGLIVDGSGSISRTNWGKIKEFLINLTNQFEISEKGTHLSIMEYSTRPNLQIKFNTFKGARQNPVNLAQAIRELNRGRGSTYIDRALKLANEEMFTVASGMRPEVQKFAIVLTDGKQTTDRDPYTELDVASQPLKDKNVQIYALGIGTEFDLGDLTKIATNFGFVFTAATFDELQNVVSDIAEGQCTGCENKIDLIYGIPTSTAISSADFAEMKSFLKDSLRFLKVANDKVHVSFVEYSDSAEQTVKLDKFYSSGQLENYFENSLQQSGTQFNTAAALDRASDNGFTIFGGTRPSSPKVMVLVAPGSTGSQDATIKAAAKLRSTGAKLITLSIGNNVNRDLIKTISSQPKRRFNYHATDMIGANDFTNNIINTACNSKYEKCPRLEQTQPDCPSAEEDECSVDRDCADPNQSCCQSPGSCKRSCAAHRKNCLITMDVGIIMDTSESVTSGDFQEMKKFVKSLIHEVADSENDVKVGLMQYDSDARLVRDFNGIQSAAELTQAVDRMDKGRSSQRRIDLALRGARRDLFSLKGGMRQGHPRQLVILTSGRSPLSGTVESAAEGLDNVKVNRFAVGIKGAVGVSFLRELATDNRYVFKANRPEQLTGQVSTIQQAMCQQKPGKCPAVTRFDPGACPPRFPSDELIPCGPRNGQVGPTTKEDDYVCPGESKCCRTTGECFLACQYPPRACGGKHDLTLALDASSAGGQAGFEKVKQFAKEFIDGFNIGQSQTRVALVTFGNTATVNYRLNSRADKQAIKNSIDALSFRGGTGRPAAALSVANEIYTAENGMRDQTFNKSLVLIHDGRFQDGEAAVRASKSLRDKFVDVFDVAVGQGANIDTIQRVVSPEPYDSAFITSSYNALDPNLRRLTERVCEGAQKLVEVVGPPGPPGIKGDTGAKGAPGARGVSGSPGPEGPAGGPGLAGGKGPPGKPGPPGRIGNIGTLTTVPGSKGPLYQPETQFTTALQIGGLPGDTGRPGLRGLDGMPGVPGSRGPSGDRGPPGPPGPMGPRGMTGRDGIDGDQGPPGSEGPVGDPGQKGPVGDSGTAGLNGMKGHTGMRGVKGQKGPRGDPGDDGATGKPGARGGLGNRGPPGATGPPGRLGTTGQPGTTGPPGVPGVAGGQGNTGAPGSPGAPGPAGPKGSQGPPGPTGNPGYSGESGNIGLRGIKGVSGSHGLTGPTGSRGPKGSTGSQGPAGAAGKQGQPGETGARGDEGATGSRGLIGDRGRPGQRGSSGEKGTSGRDGQQGVQGAPGSRGRRGNPGGTGPAGLQGVDGDRGSQGQQGFTGPNGPSGVKGNAGESGTRGVQGNKGEEGDQGEVGAPGLPGERGNRGRIGSSGKQGPNGLAGPPGDDGSAGELGAPGFPGPSGPIGFPGAKGARGVQGKVGDRGQGGPAGLKGEQGPTGAAGLPGPAGEMGDSGSRGDTGDDGKPGTAGEAGSSGSPGEAGPVGKPGPKGSAGSPGESGKRGGSGRAGEMGDPGDAGLPGNAGQRGNAGPSGERGIPGPPGEIGPLGPVGSAGPPGSDGLQGKPGARGEPGDQGRSGGPGSPGSDGANGPDGERGPSGEMGEKGPKGQKGDVGSSGANGIRGAQGERGDAGTAGRPGYPGGMGSAGPLGGRGARGAVGGKGEQGDRGLTGAAGEDGPPGPMGSTGPKGSRGETGPAGAQGARGANGQIGSRGPDGAVGLTGTGGRPGPPGARGIPGDVGEPGSRGEAGLLGASGQDGDAGGSGDLGPAGALGAPGPPGPAGPGGTRGGLGAPGIAGAPGESGGKGERGNAGSNGRKGSAGKSGQRGFPGVKGSRGEVGSDGTTGSNGPQGYAGRSGAKGLAGDRGAQGVQGPGGPTGVTGSQGAKGTSGPEGATGPTGEPGARGETGKQGEQGQTGEGGDKGFAGEQGQKGERGIQGPPGPPGAFGRKGVASLAGRRGPQGPKGERGEIGEPGSSGLSGTRGPEGPAGVMGPSGRKGDRGARGPDGLRGQPGPPGPPGHTARASVPSERVTYPSISSSSKNPNLYRSFPGANEDLEVTRTSDVLTALVSLSNQVHFYKSPIGTKKFPARTCRDLRMCYGSALKNGEYWIDPNEGIPDDAVEVHCNFETNSTCIYPSSNSTEKRKWYSGPDRYQWLGQDLNGLGQVRYVADSTQLTFLRLLSDRAKQTITYHCKNSVAWYNEESKHYEHSIKLMGDNGIELHASSSNKFKPRILRDDCRVKDGTWRKTVVEVDTHKTHRLPVNDIAVYDIGDKEEEFGVEIGPVCFS